MPRRSLSSLPSRPATSRRAAVETGSSTASQAEDTGNGRAQAGSEPAPGRCRAVVSQWQHVTSRVHCTSFEGSTLEQCQGGELTLGALRKERVAFGGYFGSRTHD